MISFMTGLPSCSCKMRNPLTNGIPASTNVANCRVKVVKIAGFTLPPTVQVGMTIRVIYQDDRYDLDRDLVVLGIRRSINSDGAIAYKLTVATINQWKLRDTHTLVASVDEGEILIGHPQIDANVYWENFRELVGDDQTDHIAEMPFFLSTEVVTIRQEAFSGVPRAPRTVRTSSADCGWNFPVNQSRASRSRGSRRTS